MTTRHYRSIWISDIHLGTRGCKAEFLLDFLRHNDSDTLYLVGDIVDGWRLKRSWYWAQSHNDVIQKVLCKARKGTKVIYIPGNHDERLRDYTQLQMGGVLLLDEVVHVTADGRKLLVLHGDAFDGVVRYARWLAFLGDWAYGVVLNLNHHYNVARRCLGLPYWSLSAYLKSRVKNAVEFVSNFANAITEEARKRGVDGIVCSHIHQANIKDFAGVLYCNDGDWSRAAPPSSSISMDGSRSSVGSRSRHSIRSTSRVRRGVRPSPSWYRSARMRREDCARQ